MNKTRIKIAFIALCVIGCFAYTVTTLLRALNAPYKADKSAGSVPYVSSRSVSSDLPKVTLRNIGTMYDGRGTMDEVRWTRYDRQSQITYNLSPITYHLSSAQVHSIGGGGGSRVESRESRVESNVQYTMSNIQCGTLVPLLAVNSSAFSVNRDLTETDGESVVGKSMRKIAPPDDGGSGIGGPGNIAPPGDEGELLGSPVGPVPFLFLALMALLYLSFTHVKKAND